MENIDYEKAYKAVLQTATQWIKDGCTDKEKICLKSVFPELRESEDERIRNVILKLILGMRDEIFTAQDELVTKPKVLAYLEKQKNLEGDFARGYDSGYANCLQSHGAEWFEKQKEQKYTHEGPLTAVPFHKPEEGVEYDMYFEDAQEYIEKRGFNIPWNDGNVFIDEDYMTQTVANVLKWADEHPIKQKLAGWNEEDLATIKDLKETITSSGTWHVITPAQASAYLKWLIGLERSGNPKQAAWKPSEDQLKCLFNAENVLRKHNYIAIAYKIEELHYCLEQLKQS